MLEKNLIIQKEEGTDFESFFSVFQKLSYWQQKYIIALMYWYLFRKKVKKFFAGGK